MRATVLTPPQIHLAPHGATPSLGVAPLRLVRSSYAHPNPYTCARTSKKPLRVRTCQYAMTRMANSSTNAAYTTRSAMLSVTARKGVKLLGKRVQRDEPRQLDEPASRSSSRVRMNRWASFTSYVSMRRSASAEDTPSADSAIPASQLGRCRAHERHEWLTHPWWRHREGHARRRGSRS